MRGNFEIPYKNLAPSPPILSPWGRGNIDEGEL